MLKIKNIKKINELINGKPIELEIHPITAVILAIAGLYKIGTVLGKALYYLTIKSFKIMTTTIQPQQRNSITYMAIIALIIGFSFLFYMAFQHGDGTAYSTGYEMGGIMSKILKTGTFKNGIGLGSLIAVLASWERNKSILWAVLHAVFGWVYVIYFAFTRNNVAPNN